MPEEKKQAEEVKAEARRIISQLENAPLNTWVDLQEVLEKITDQVDLVAHPPIRVKVYHVRYLWFLSGVWFNVVFFWAYMSDMITNPVRDSDFKVDTEKRVITIQQF